MAGRSRPTMLEAMSTRSSIQSDMRRFERAPSDEISIGEVMHTGVSDRPPEVPLRYAAEMMARHRVHAVVVLGEDEEGGLWGVVRTRTFSPRSRVGRWMHTRREAWRRRRS